MYPTHVSHKKWGAKFCAFHSESVACKQKREEIQHFDFLVCVCVRNWWVLVWILKVFVLNLRYVQAVDFKDETVVFEGVFTLGRGFYWTSRSWLVHNCLIKVCFEGGILLIIWASTWKPQNMHQSLSECPSVNTPRIERVLKEWKSAISNSLECFSYCFWLQLYLNVQTKWAVQ